LQIPTLLLTNCAFEVLGRRSTMSALLLVAAAACAATTAVGGGGGGGEGSLHAAVSTLGTVCVACLSY